MSTALLLFAHGARDPEWALPLRRIENQVRQLAPGDVAVALAFLEFMSPTLADCAADLVCKGARRIVVAPLFIAQGGHLKREVPELVAGLRGRFPEVCFELAPAIGESAPVVQAMAVAVLDHLAQQG